MTDADDGYGYETDGDWDDDLHDPMDGYEPDPADYFERQERERYAAMSLPGRCWHVIRSVASAWWWLLRECVSPTVGEPPF